MKAGDVIADRFELEHLAGMGGFGEVWRARDRRRGGPVALKIAYPRPGLEERFLREARLLAALQHPGIVAHRAHGKTAEGRAWLAMEWLDGETLAERLKRGSLGVAESVALARRLADALAALHVRGGIHRDVTPANVFLVGCDLARVKLLDFGVARLRETPPGGTRPGQPLGTPGYMAPEQARGAGKVDARADVFSLGCVLYECLTGRSAFSGEGFMAILAKILLQDVPRVRELRPEVPAALDELVAEMTDKDPEGRPIDAAAAAFALRELGEGGAGEGAGRPPAVLGGGELRLVSLVVAGTETPGSGVPTDLPTPAPIPSADRALHAAVDGHGGRAEVLADGSVAVILSGSRSATDQAQQAARCALAMRPLLPESPIAIVTGRVEVTGRLPVGEAIDRAARLVQRGGSAIWLDDATAGLLDAAFEVAGAGGGAFQLHGERPDPETVRTVLGRVTPCVGRERELSILDATFDECLAEPVARAVLLVGPEGVGKSRLRREIAARVRTRGPVETWVGGGDPMRASSPFGLLAPMLRRVGGILDSQPLSTRQQRLKSRVALHVPAAEVDRVTTFLGELLGLPFPDAADPPLRAARANAVLMGDQLRRAFEDFLAAELAASPVVLLLDDLHLSDPPSLKFVDAALRTLADRRLLVVGAARPEVHERFPRLWVDRGVQEIRLIELSRRASLRLVGEILGDAVAPEVAERLAIQAGGNALYLEELVRSVAAGQATLPESVLAMVQARLEALPGEARRILRAGSIFGRVFPLAGAAVLHGETSTAVLEELVAELCDKEVLVPGGEESYRFRHALWREAAYATLTDADRALGHRGAAAWLERHGETDAALIAEHWERAGEAGPAAAAWLRAAQQALDGNDFAGALARAEQAASFGLEGEALGAARLVAAEAHAWRGEHGKAGRAAEDALDLLPAGSAAWFRAMTEVLGTRGRQGQYDLLEARAAELHALPFGAETSGAQVEAAAHAALHLIFGGRTTPADLLLEDVTRAHVALGEPQVAGKFLAVQAVRAAHRGDVGEHLDLVERAIRASEAAGDLRNACAQRVNAGYALLEIGAWDQAMAILSEALAAGERLGSDVIVAAARQNLGMALAYRGRLEEGRRAEEEAIAQFARFGDRRMEAGSRAYLARILLLAGDRGGAEWEARASAAGAADVPPIRVVALGTLAQVRLLEGRDHEALEAALEAMELLGRTGGIEGGDGLVRLAHAEALHAAGRLDEARTAILEARDRLFRRADRLGTTWREHFLRIPEHARTLLLAAEWDGRTG